MVPAHYHASIGGVTAAFMTLSYVVLAALGLSIETPRLKRVATWQPVVFGVGQMVFAAGFAIAGAYGMSRKAYGAEQASRSLAESIGLGVMGIGGLIATIGGLLFLVVVTVIWRRSASIETRTADRGSDGAWRKRWLRETRTASIRFRS
jgi:heme/copper-type cytochrome/quinol oxidase subunit 1